MTADAFFDAAAELGRVIADQRSANRQAKRDARNARRRSRYVPVARQPRAPVSTGGEDWTPDGCICASVAMPPCSWCEGVGNA